MGKGGWIAAGSAGAVVVVLALAQVLLPRLAASRISSRVGRYGKVESVSVSAWPALKLLWGDANSVRVRAKSLSLSPAQAAGLLWEGRDVASMDLSAQSVQLESLHLTDASLQQRGSALHAQALVSEAAVQAALPTGFGVRLLRSEDGRVEVRATGGLFGVGASVNALALASDGKLVAHPVGFLVEALQLTLFSNPHVYVEGVGASVAGEDPLSYRLTMSARLR
ncbi:MAG TPA: LmeA family phospholipid-binding protein [Solirubrobacteraceae bacterium]|nr:LmeA family phospholipid-binding protein [Solirubrobacteraceae bacterium]